MRDFYYNLFNYHINVSLSKMRSKYDFNIYTPYNIKQKSSSDEIAFGGAYSNNFERYTHSVTELCICLKGNMGVWLGDDFHVLGQNDTALITPGTEHGECRYRGSNYIALWILIAQSKVFVYLTGWEYGKKILLRGGFYMEDSFHICEDISEFVTETTKRPVYYEHVSKCILYKILASVKRSNTNMKYYEGIPITDGNSMVIKVNKYIEQNFDRNIKLDDVSKMLCISNNHLNNLYKSLTGQTIMQYLEEIRIEKAKEMLKNTNFTVQKIAYELAYCDQAHFSRTFKKKTGQCPSNFKRITAVV